MLSGKILKICPNGHSFYKSSNCPTCPVCEKERRPHYGFLSLLAAPARRALERKGIHSPEALSRFSEAEILQLHGMGPKAMSILLDVMSKENLRFRP